MLAPTFSAFQPSQHQIQRDGIGFSRGMTDDELRKIVPSAFADAAHDSRSARYAFIPTSEIISGMRNNGFLPVKAVQSKARDESKKDHTKHEIRFRREDQLGRAEAREIILINSHDGTSAYKLNAGIFRLVCSNGLVVGREDIRQTVYHKGNIVDNVIDGATRIIYDFDAVQADIELMKSVQLEQPLQIALAKSALMVRFNEEDENLIPLSPEQVLRPKRAADNGADAWSVMNVVQEHLIKGGDMGSRRDANNRIQRRRTRTVAGIDQADLINRALWKLGAEVARLAK